MKLLRKIRQGLALPPHVAARKVIEIAARTIKKRQAKNMDKGRHTYALDAKIPMLHTYFLLKDNGLLAPHRALIAELATLYCNHQFDLLGSGWTQVCYKMQCNGTEGVQFPKYFENKNVSGILALEINLPNRTESARIFSLLDPQYIPIDWQIDFKSGYRWSASSWYKSVNYGTTLGADVKVPWELARMQHFSTLAEASFLSHLYPEDFAPKEIYAREFRNQIIDFIATNPPRWGVNWTTSMDIGIRAVNWLISYDFFRSIGIEFDAEFEEIFRRSIYEHGNHIIHNLEYSPDLRGNHYLADIVGLLFIAAYLPCSAEADMWLAFSIQELFVETDLQFLSDGGNFEASVPYHRLSAEMILYAEALLSKLPPEKIVALSTYNARLKKGLPKVQPAPLVIEQLQSKHHFTEKIQAILTFAAHTIKPNGNSPQIGDNDSGRFYKLFPNFIRNLSESGALTEVHNDHRELFMCPTFLKGHHSLQPKNNGEPFQKITKSHSSFPDFGLDIYRSSRYYCSVRCGAIGQRGKGGHAHNDQLSIELQVGGRDFFVDNGTYLYTPSPIKRNHFRSTAAHNTLSLESKEQNAWLHGGGDVLFWMLGDRSQATVIARNENNWIGEHRGFGAIHRRELVFTDTSICGRDICVITSNKTVSFHCSPEVEVLEIHKNAIILKNSDITIVLSWDKGIGIIEPSVYSAGYGLIEPSRVVRISFMEDAMSWKIDTVGTQL